MTQSGTRRLWLLGPARVEQIDKTYHEAKEDALAVPRFRSRRTVGLLGYLVAERRRVARGVLAALFWPDQAPSKGRSSLSRALYNLAQILPECWELDRQAVAFAPSAGTTVDLYTLLELAAQERWAEAAEMLGGDFLEDVNLDDNPEFENWLLGERERWRGRAENVLKRVIESYTRRGKYADALRQARRLLQQAPWDEEGHKHAMRLLAWTGQRGAALRQFESCKRALTEELDVEPAPETVALYKKIQAGRLGRPPQLPAFLTEKRPNAETERPLFVGREGELARLDAFIDAALTGQGRVIFITGGPGRGKTALLAVFAQRAMERLPSLLVVNGNCNAYSGVGDPYLPYRDLMAMLTGDVEGRWEAGVITSNHARRLWTVFPRVVQLLLNHGPDLLDVLVPGAALLSLAMATGQDDAPWFPALREQVKRRTTRKKAVEQSHFFQQVTDVLHSLAKHQPLLLILDDIQWADTASISLLFHLGRRLADANCRILIACAYRPEEVALSPNGERHPLAKVLSEFKRTYGDVWVDLGAVTEREGRGFVDALLDAEANRLAPGFRAALFDRTGGHPLFTIELLRAMQQRGDLLKDADGVWIQGSTLDWQLLPARVEAVIEARIDRLPPDLQSILTIASVEGEVFTANVVADVRNVPERALLRQLSHDLERQHRLVREQEEIEISQRRLSRFRFGHVLFQDYLYERLGQGERRLLHGKVGAAMERLWGEQADEIAAQLARHYIQAGHREKAVAYSLRAAHRARLGYADEEARAFYQQAVAIAAKESIARDMIAFTGAEFKEAPMLAQLVASGELPPVEQRLPLRDDVKVILPVDGTGEYGGTWRNVTWSSFLNLRTTLYDPPIRWKADYTGYEPGLLKSWQVSRDGTWITWRFRKGVRWSDGVPFTTADLRFWWEDMATNPDVGYSRVPDWGSKADGTPMDVVFPDKYTMVMAWDAPHYTTVFAIAQGYWPWEKMMKPRHYLEQFHPRYTQGASYGDLELADRWWLTPGYPTLYAWTVESVTPGERVVLVRNPYYWKVDVAGNQLPYIDRLDIAIAPDKDVRVLEASQGKYTASFRATGDPKDIPFLTERARSGGYYLHPRAVSGAGAWPGWIVNQDFHDPSVDNWEEIRDLLRDKRFRRALSHAMDRQRIIDMVWDGVGSPQQGTISPQSWHFASPEGQRVYEEWANAYVEHDPELTKRLLDEVGTVDADGDGWRELPSGASFQLGFHVTGWSEAPVNVEATESFVADLRAVGIEALIYDVRNMPEALLRVEEQGYYMLRDCHASELDIWTYPTWIFPVDDKHGWSLQGRWRMTGGAEGVQPAGVAKALLDIYDRGLAEPDIERRHELVWEAIRIHIEEGPFFIGASGDQAVPVVIADNFHGVPDLVILGPWQPGTPGNLRPEQFWIEQ
jgi:ABC-type transport system substrate-binding protein/DNA-binding SARP family transcriptional activator